MQYVCRDPGATVRGANVLATVEAFRLHPSVIDVLWRRHGLDRAALRETPRVRVQVMLDVLRDIEARVGLAKLREVGARIVQTALFPPEYATAEDVLLGLDAIYGLNHTGDVGHYHATRLPDGGIRIACATPYPAAFERGVIEGIASHASLARERHYVVAYEHGPESDPDVTCVCTVTRVSGGAGSG